MKVNTEEILPTELQVGWRFVSNRPEEGNVTVVCEYGKCTHDDRPQSVHVRDGHSHWFIALPEYEPVQRVTGFSF